MTKEIKKKLKNYSLNSEKYAKIYHVCSHECSR